MPPMAPGIQAHRIVGDASRCSAVPTASQTPKTSSRWSPISSGPYSGSPRHSAGGIEPIAAWNREGHLDVLRSRIHWTEMVDFKLKGQKGRWIPVWSCELHRQGLTDAHRYSE